MIKDERTNVDQLMGDTAELTAWLLPIALITIPITVAITVGAYFLFPFVVARLPVDYFRNRDCHRPSKSIVTRFLRNAVGGFLLVIGPIVVLPIFVLPPGSGLALMVVGLALMDFSGKQAVLDRAVRFPGVLPLLNWMRKRRRVPPFEL